MSTAATRRTPIGPILTILGGALLVIGSFLTWFTLSGQGASSSGSGIDGGDGWYSLISGVVLIAVGVVGLQATRRSLAVLALVAGLVGGGAALLNALTVRDQLAEQITGASAEEARAFIDQLIDSGQLEITWGIGLYLVMAGGVIALVGGALQLSGGGSAAPAMPAVGSASTFSAPPPAAPVAGEGPPITPPAPAPPDAPSP